MKKIIYSLPWVFAWMLFNSLPVSAQIDVFTRGTLYYTGARTDKIESTDPSVTSSGELTLTAAQATKCDKQTCDFNLGFFAMRSTKTGVLSTYGLFQLDGGGLAGNTVSFRDKEDYKAVIFPLKLKIGFNKVTVSVDPYKKIAESNEDNNSFYVNIRVNRK